MSPTGAYGDMLQNYYLEKFEHLRRQRRERLAAITTCGQALAYVEWAKKTVRTALLSCMPEKTPLNTVCTGTLDLGDIVLEKLLFESRPGLFVSASLYRPAKVSTGKHPGVVNLCGHSANGKGSVNYQACCQRLAQHGFIVLAPDPIAQGERLQYANRPADPLLTGSCCTEHNLYNKELGLFGDNFSYWRTYEAIRATDCLLERPEVDPARLGVTGCSGGGTMTSYLWAVEDRLNMAAPTCYLTTFYRNFDNELPVDAEQAIPGIAATGFEMADFLIARAPQPAILLIKKNDFFDPRGSEECYEETMKIYRLLGAEENFRRNDEEGPHGYTPENREAMCRFFCEHAGIEFRSGETFVLPDEKLLCTPENATVKLPGAVPVPEILAEQASRPRGPVTLEEVQTFLELEAPADVPDYKVLRNGRYNGRSLSIYGVKTEPGICAFLHTLDKADVNVVTPAASVRLIVTGTDAESELVERYADEVSGRTFTLDPRGFGKSEITTSDRNANRFSPYAGEYFYDAAGLMLDLPLFSGRCRDVLAALALLKANGAGKIHLTGSGVACTYALFAAAAAPELVAALDLEDYPGSIAEMIREGGYCFPQSYLPRRMLNHFDLPDLVELLKQRMPVRILSRRDRHYNRFE